MNKELLRMQMLAGIITESEYKAKLDENEDEAPLVITVKVTENGKNKLGLYTKPTEIRMTSDKNNSQTNSSYYYIGNTEFLLSNDPLKQVKVYFAQYRHDIKEILVSYLEPKSPEEFNKLVDSQYISDMKGLIPDGNHILKDFVVGGTDHRDYFEIVAVE